MKALALAIAFTACLAGEAFSDYFLRGKLHATNTHHVYGLDPSSWDIVCTAGITAFGLALLFVALRRPRTTVPHSITEVNVRQMPRVPYQRGDSS